MQRESSLQELVVIWVVEEDQLIQAVVAETLTDRSALHTPYLRAIIRLFPEDRSWTIEDVKEKR